MGNETFYGDGLTTYVDKNLDSRSDIYSSLIMFLVHVSCFSFGEGIGKKTDKPTTEKVHGSMYT